MVAIFGHHPDDAAKWWIVWVREARLASFDFLLHWLINVPFAKSACCWSLRPFEPHFLGWVKRVSQGLMVFLLRLVVLLLRWMVLLLRWMWRSHFLHEIAAHAVGQQMQRAI